MFIINLFQKIKHKSTQTPCIPKKQNNETYVAMQTCYATNGQFMSIYPKI